LSYQGKLNRIFDQQLLSKRVNKYDRPALSPLLGVIGAAEEVEWMASANLVPVPFSMASLLAVTATRIIYTEKGIKRLRPARNERTLSTPIESVRTIAPSRLKCYKFLGEGYGFLVEDGLGVTHNFFVGYTAADAAHAREIIAAVRRRAFGEQPGLPSLLLRGLLYLGGNPALQPGPIAGVTLAFAADGFAAQQGELPLARAPWSAIREIAVEGRDAAERRVTAGRLFALGILAFGLPKTTTTSFLVVRLENAEMIFQTSLLPMQLRASLAPYLALPSHRTTDLGQTTDPAPDPFESLRQLSGLLDKGLIASSDFAAKKEEILKRI
jgi:hypothetical protein